MALSVYQQSPQLIFSKTECILFWYHICSKSHRSEGPVFNLRPSITVAFLFSLICSEAFLNFHLTMSLSEENKCSYVKKFLLTSCPEIEFTDIETDFFFDTLKSGSNVQASLVYYVFKLVLTRLISFLRFDIWYTR